MIAATWATGDCGLRDNAWGYTRAIRALRAAGAAAGIEWVADAELQLHFCYPTGFRPRPGRRNVLFTMYEQDDLPPLFVEAFARADAILTPSDYCTRVFQRRTDRPVLTVPLGVDLERFPGIDRPPPRTRPFRWLWMGAHNPRKGYQEVAAAWDAAFLGDPRVELYLKTTRDDEGAGSRAVYRNVIRDTRRVDDAELLRIYAAADAFLFPSMGEGFGLTLAEAMATALPAVALLAGGVTEFADAGTCVPVRWHPAAQRVQDTAEGPWYDVLARRADVPDLVRAMRWVTEHWHRARRLGHTAHRRAQHFSWATAAARLRTALVALSTSADHKEVPCQA